MEKSAYIVVLITTATGEEAQQISRRLLEQRKAACVNIIIGHIEAKSRFSYNDRCAASEPTTCWHRSRHGTQSSIFP